MTGVLLFVFIWTVLAVVLGVFIGKMMSRGDVLAEQMDIPWQR